MVDRRLLAVPVLLVLLTGCAPDSGTVYKRYTEYVSKPVAGTNRYVCVDDGHGNRGCSLVDVTTYQRCVVGKPWPKCRDAAS
jgi:hypothetical protein